MSNIKYSEAYKSASPLVKSALDYFFSFIDLDSCYLEDFNDNSIGVYSTSNNFIFIFREIDAFSFSVECRDNGFTVFQQQFSDIEEYKAYINAGFDNGFVDDYGDSHFYKSEPVKINGRLFEEASNIADDSDEEDCSTLEDSVNKLVSIESIVPDDITQIRVVALRYNCQIIAFRFKTNVGAFDMRIETATKYGLGGFKTEKFINLEKVNGILMSSTERKKRVCVPDVSLCEIDCRKLIDAVFQCEG